MEQKQSKKRHRKYDADFKKEVLKMIESGLSSLTLNNSNSLIINYSVLDLAHYGL